MELRDLILEMIEEAKQSAMDAEMTRIRAVGGRIALGKLLQKIDELGDELEAGDGNN
jgi:hypothetical protein